MEYRVSLRGAQWNLGSCFHSVYSQVLFISPGYNVFLLLIRCLRAWNHPRLHVLFSFGITFSHAICFHWFAPNWYFFLPFRRPVAESSGTNYNPLRVSGTLHALSQSSIMFELCEGSWGLWRPFACQAGWHKMLLQRLCCLLLVW